MGQLSSAQARVRLAEINLKQAQVNYGREEQFYDRYNPSELLQECGMTTEQIVEDVETLLK